MEESITKRTEALQQAMTLQAGDKDSRIRMVMDQIKQQEQEVFDAMQQVMNPKLIKMQGPGFRFRKCLMRCIRL